MGLRIADTHYVLGSVMGPHPFPTIVRDFQKIIGEEIRRQVFRAEDASPMRSLPVSAAAATPWARFTTSSTAPRYV